MADHPEFREPIVSASELEAMRESNRRLVESFNTFKQIEFSPHETAESRRIAREEFFR